MMKSLRESKAGLSELVEAASQGEDVLITVRGKVKARLTKAGVPDRASTGAVWARQLRALQRAYGKPRPKTSVERILADLRQDRI